MITIRNKSRYPDAEVKQLVRDAVAPFDLKGVLIEVKDAKTGTRFSGTAYDYVPYGMKPWPKTSWRAIKIRVGSPDLFPMRDKIWRHGWEENHHGEWPLFTFKTWQEALVYVAAHEAKHIEDYEKGDTREKGKRRPQLELKCELAAAKVLDHYKQSQRKESAVSEAATENGLGTELRSAVEGIEGVSVTDSPKGNYYTIKHGTKTLGYVNGRKKIRVDFPSRGKVREKLAVSDASQIPTVVEQLKTYIPPLEAEASPDPKPSRRKKAEA